MKRILVVDDDSSVLQCLTRALSEYDVTVARDGCEALIALRNLKAFDLLLTDFFMPSMTGDELVARVHEHRPELKVLMMTGHADILDRAALPWWESVAHVPKPFHVQALRECVNGLLDIASVPEASTGG
jgi:CheY-like chemotaxis protein